jgi:hypothetical protein
MRDARDQYVCQFVLLFHLPQLDLRSDVSECHNLAGNVIERQLLLSDLDRLIWRILLCESQFDYLVVFKKG